MSVGTVLALVLSIPAVGHAQQRTLGSCDVQNRYTILVHGGTVTRREDVTDAQLALVRSVVAEARETLASGATALDVVVGAIVRLEDSGLLDAGKGSYRNKAGFVENDASVMEGQTGRAGAVAAMQRLKNPILGARLVMEKTPHVFFVGPVGEETLIGLGAEPVDDPATYFVPYREVSPAAPGPGTVGAVALDRCGHLAAGTSTGGTAGKMPGRVGDSPIIGASTFANERYALSATGVGEYFIRRSVTRDIAMRAEYQGVSLKKAADHVIHELIGKVDRVSGAIIAVDRDGAIVLSAANVLGERYGYASESVRPTVGVELP
jgi:isoaspartyl peptidase/L-asparaginase-like protein (Ntn-hydrolase superfamily)